MAELIFYQPRMWISLQGIPTFAPPHLPLAGLTVLFPRVLGETRDGS